MRWDNPIKPDWFEFPDLAAFPDYASEPRNTDDYDMSVINESISSGNADLFIDEVQKVAGSIAGLGKLKNFFKEVTTRKLHSRDDIQTECGQALYEHGRYITRISFNDLDVESLVDSYLSKPDWTPSPGSYDRGGMLSGNHLQVIQSKFSKAGILKGVEEYSGKKRSVNAAYLHVSTSTDHHYKQFFGDAETTPRWTNLHIDPKQDVIKAIVYLNDIDENAGGFGFVPKSHRYVYPLVQEIFGRAISTGNYCDTSKKRKSVFSLPKQLRVSYNFGRCIMDDSNLARELDKRFQRVTSDMGNVTVFDPGAGMHQGGIVKEGKRIAIQVLMK